MANKNYCPTHHLYYNGSECPLCREERTATYVKKFGKTDASEEKKKFKNEREINEDDITKLMDKFNSKANK